MRVPVPCERAQMFPYEDDPASTSYVPASEGRHYVAGGLYGGATQALHVLLSVSLSRQRSLQLMLRGRLRACLPACGAHAARKLPGNNLHGLPAGQGGRQPHRANCTYTLQRLKQVTDGDLERRRTPRFNDESVLNYVFASHWPPNISHTLLSPRYVGPDLLKQPPYVNCGAQIPSSEIRIMHLEKCHEVCPASS